MSIKKIAERHVSEVGGVITSLRAIQSELGYLPINTEEVVADVFNLSRAEVLGVISFYSDFRRKPSAKICLKICAAEACQAVGGRQYQEDVTKALGDNVEFEHVYCLGLCSVAPSAMLEDELIGRADIEKTLRAIERHKENAVQ